MNKNIGIKCITPSNTLSNKTLQDLPIHTIEGTLITEESFEDLFQVNIDANVIDNSSISFQDMNLNIFNCQIDFRIIETTALNKGMFIKYTHDFIITHKSFNIIQNFKLLVLYGYLSKNSNCSLNFSIVIGLDFSMSSELNSPIINPSNTYNDQPFSLLFDKEFI